MSGGPLVQGTGTAHVSSSIAENQALRAIQPAGWKVTDPDDRSMTIDPPGEPLDRSIQWKYR